MVFYIDYKRKNVYITSPKCGCTSISNYLNTEWEPKYVNNEFTNNSFTKFVIFRQDILERFLSGFYEDLISNTCFDNIEVTFNDYLLFLYKCFKEKIPNVNNLSIFLNKDIPVWWGNCSNKTLNLTDSNGDFICHIQTQKFALEYHFFQLIKNDKNVKVIEFNSFFKLFPMEKKRSRNKSNYYLNFGQRKLCDIKKHNWIIDKECLNETQKKMILEIYDEDIKFFNELKLNFKYYLYNTNTINQESTKVCLNEQVDVEQTEETEEVETEQVEEVEIEQIEEVETEQVEEVEIEQIEEVETEQVEEV